MGEEAAGKKELTTFPPEQAGMEYQRYLLVFQTV